MLFAIIPTESGKHQSIIYPLKMTSIKRQKTSKQCSDDPVVLNLASLPAEIFNGVTSYLSNTSCALLGVSLTAPSSSKLWRDGSSSTSSKRNLSTASTFVLSSIIARVGDTTLDLRKDTFGERNLQENIDDEDLHALLMFINAPEKLERLKFPLNRFTKITGIGLQPLWISCVRATSTKFKLLYDITESLRVRISGSYFTYSKKYYQNRRE